MKPQVSVLIPSRGRLQGLLDAILSCFNRAYNADAVEVIVRLDWDDTTTPAAVERIALLFSGRNIRVIAGPRLRGYLSMGKFANECAAMSKGDWLLFLSDDAWICGGAWEIALATHDPSREIVKFSKVQLPDNASEEERMEFSKRTRCDFPIISRALYERIGCFCPVEVVDWFWLDAAKKHPRIGGEIVPIEVCHAYQRRPFLETVRDCDKEEHVIEYRSAATQAAIKSSLNQLNPWKRFLEKIMP